MGAFSRMDLEVKGQWDLYKRVIQSEDYGKEYNEEEIIQLMRNNIISLFCKFDYTKKTEDFKDLTFIQLWEMFSMVRNSLLERRNWEHQYSFSKKTDSKDILPTEETEIIPSKPETKEEKIDFILQRTTFLDERQREEYKKKLDTMSKTELNRIKSVLENAEYNVYERKKTKKKRTQEYIPSRKKEQEGSSL